MSNTTASIGSNTEFPVELKLKKFLEEEEGDAIVMEIRDELLKNVTEKIRQNYIKTQVHEFVVKCALNAIKQAIKMNFCFHNPPFSEQNPSNWEADTTCEPSNADNWAAYRVPLSYEGMTEQKNMEDITSETEKMTHEKKEKGEIISSQEITDEEPPCESHEVIDIINYLEDLSTSSEEIEEEMDVLSWKQMEIYTEDQVSMKTQSQRSSTMSSLYKKVSVIEESMSVVFRRAIIGEADRGLSVPHVAVPIRSVIKEVPEIEQCQYDVIQTEKRKMKVVRKPPLTCPKRRSDIKIKTEIIEVNPIPEKSKK